MTNKKVVLFFLLPILVSFFLHAHVFKLDLIGYHVWRQTQTQTVIYNFSFSDNNILHPRKFDLRSGSTSLLYEFPLYQWLVAQVNNCIGYSVAHSRAVTFLIFILFLAAFYKLLSKFVSKEVALITNALLCFSPLLYYYCVNPIPDILALCFATWSLTCFFTFLHSKKTSSFFLFGLLLMLASLVKLPYILFGGVFIVYSYRSLKEKLYAGVLKNTLVLMLLFIPVFIWYLEAIPTWKNNDLTSGIIHNNKTIIELLDFIQFHLISSAPELLTNYAACIFLVTGIFLFAKRKNRLVHHGYFLALFALISLYVLFELNMIEKVHDYYLMPFIPLIFLVVAYGVRYFYEKRSKTFVFALAMLVPLTAWLRIDHRWSLEKPGFVPDYMTQQPVINTIIPANAQCIIDYDDSKFISLYYLKREGYSLYKNEINPSVLKEYFLKGAHYLITENLTFLPADYKDFDFEEIYNKNLKIYKLNLR